MPRPFLNGVLDAQPEQFAPDDFGWVAWTTDPAGCTGGTILTAGQMATAMLVVRRPTLISSVTVSLTAAGATLANVGFALYSATGALLTSSINANGATAANFQAVNNRTITFTPQTIPAGRFYVGFWATGTTMPTLLRAANGSNALNVGTTLAGGIGMRFGRANTGLTNAAPAQMAQTSNDLGAWFVAAA